jgi:hypothetical protein
MTIIVNLAFRSDFGIIVSMKKPAPKAKELRLQVIATQRLLDQLDEIRAREPGLPSRSEMTRKLIERAHESLTRKK